MIGGIYSTWGYIHSVSDGQCGGVREVISDWGYI